MSDTSQFDPLEPIFQGARNLVNNGLMQSDLDANHFRLINLDTSNLNLSESPHDAPPQLHKWLNSYDSQSLDFSFEQPSFTDLSDNLTQSQQQAIVSLGHIVRGTWNATPIASQYLPTLDNISSPLGPVNMANQRISGLRDPAVDQDAVNLRFMNDKLLGLNPKEACVAATTRNEPLSGLRAVDGYAIVDGDRVLVKVQSHQSENGIYIAHAGQWIVSDDWATPDSHLRATVFVLNGDTLAGTTWYNSSPQDPPNFVLFQSNTGTVAGQGLDQSGRTIFAVGTPNRIAIGSGIDIDAAYAGQTSITTLGTVTTGIWNANVIDGEHGGTGINNFGKNITLAGNLVTALGLGAPVGSSLTFNLLGTSFLTLPVSGQVATLAGAETFFNKQIDAGQITGRLAVGRGGVPDPIGHAGQTLHTDGLNVFWA